MASTPAKIRATPNPRLPKKLKHIGEQRFKNRFPRCKVVDEARPIDATKGTSRRRKKTNQLDSSSSRYAVPPVHENLVHPMQVHTGVAHTSNVLFDDAVTTRHTSSAGVLDNGLGWESTHGHLAYNDMDSQSSMSDHSSVEFNSQSEQWYYPVGQAGVYDTNFTTAPDQYWNGHNISYPAPDMYEVGQLYGSYAYPYTTDGQEHTYAGQQTYGREESLFCPPGEGMVPTTPYLHYARTDMSMNANGYAEDLGGSFAPTEEAFGRTW
ncbi:hypothetical protein CPC08DRAFT_766649 [Agrocybe pediades]|nr:hypothetical protein CPC08DRAFT_766649 [Agrocybe pediades]